jgi:DNA replication protein DnaC
MQELYKRLKEFKLSGMASTLAERIPYANLNKLSHEQFLELLCQDEADTRADNSYKRRYSAARLPSHKKLDDFDFSFQTSLNERQVNDIATCKFIRERSNVILIGDPGTGKTHLSIAFAVSALAKEYKVLFTSVSDMLYKLHIAKADNSYHRRLQELVNYDLLVLDELGFKTLPKYAADDFFNIISKRYENKSTIITTNKNFDQWNDIFADEILTRAIVDRVLHHAIILNIRGISYRARNKEVKMD